MRVTNEFMRRHCPFVTLVLAVVFLLVSCAYAAPQTQPLRVVAGTSLISDIVADLTEGVCKCEIVTLINGASCPGHDHAKTQDFVFAAQAEVIFLHTFQAAMPQLTAMLHSVGKDADSVTVIQVQGSWLVPAKQQEAVKAIAAELVRILPACKEVIQKRAQQRMEYVRELGERCRASLRGQQRKPVVAARMQAEFLLWAGFDVVGTYGRAEEVTAARLVALVTALKDRNICAVVDNIQSGARVGEPLALELKVPHVVLSNFPSAEVDSPDYFQLLQNNTNTLQGL